MSKSINLLWWRWLLVVTAGTLVFGLALMVLPQVMLPFFNILFFGSPDNPFDAAATRYITFTYGVLGAVMVGWAIALLYIVLKPFRRGEREAWNALAWSIGIWYLIDSVFSLYSGFGANALFNTAFLVLFAIPLAATYREFHTA